MGVIHAHLGLSIAMWVVLVTVGLAALVRIVRGLQGNLDLSGLADAVTKPMLLDVLPLIILALLMSIDPTHIIALIWYYVAAVLITIRNLVQLVNSLQKR